MRGPAREVGAVVGRGPSLLARRLEATVRSGSPGAGGLAAGTLIAPAGRRRCRVRGREAERLLPDFDIVQQRNGYGEAQSAACRAGVCEAVLYFAE